MSKIRNFFNRSAGPSAGFTLVEIIIVMALVATVAVIAAALVNFSSRGLLLRSESEKIQKTIETARERADLSVNGLGWGVYFLNTSTERSYSIFSGSNFASASTTVKTLLPSNVIFIVPITSSSTEIDFAKFTDQISLNGANLNTTTAVIIGSADGATRATISINPLGQTSISY